MMLQLVGQLVVQLVKHLLEQLVLQLVLLPLQLVLLLLQPGDPGYVFYFMINYSFDRRRASEMLCLQTKILSFLGLFL